MYNSLAFERVHHDQSDTHQITERYVEEHACRQTQYPLLRVLAALSYRNADEETEQRRGLCQQLSDEYALPVPAH